MVLPAIGSGIPLRLHRVTLRRLLSGTAASWWRWVGRADTAAATISLGWYKGSNVRVLVPWPDVINDTLCLQAFGRRDQANKPCVFFAK